MPTQTFYNLPVDKKNRIKEAIIYELGQHTYEHINIQNIIKKASISRGSFYQYFENKDDVYNYFYQYLKETKFSFWGPLFTDHMDMSFLDRIKMIYVKGYEFDQTYPDLVKVAKKISESEQFKNDQIYQDGLKQSIEMYKNFIIEDQKKKIIRDDIDPEFLAKMIIEFMQKVTLEELLKEHADLKLVEKKANELIDIIGKGITKHV